MLFELKKLILPVALCCVVLCIGQSETRLDSLLRVQDSQKDLERVNTLNLISWEYRNSNTDSAIFYSRKALKLAHSLNEQKAIASSLNSLAAGFEAMSVLDSAEIYHQKSLEIKKAIGDSVGLADTYNNLGIVEDTRGNYSRALEHYFKALKIYENQSVEFDKVPMVLVNIGIVYKKQKEYRKVLEYYQRALKIYEDNDYEVGEVITLGNIGSVLLNLEDYETSIAFSERAAKLYAELGYSRYVAYMDVNIAIAKDSLKRYTEARADYIKVIDAFEKDQNLYELTNTRIALAKNFMRDNLFDLARDQLQSALAMAEDNDFKEFRVNALKQFAELNAATGNYKEAFADYRRYAVGKDSLFESDKTKTIFELETRYETEKKENQILVQRSEIAEKTMTLQRRNLQVYGSLVLAVILGLIGYLFYSQQRLKNRQLQKENELRDALAKIETQNRLQDQRLRISRDLHDNIGAQLTFIISSLDNLKYAFDIKDSGLSGKLSGISGFTRETINELRDTIWAMNKNDITLDDLKIRILGFIEKANLASDSTAFKFECADDLDPDTPLTSVEGMNLYRIIQEAVNNAFKYAEATEIGVTVSSGNNNLKIEIRDDGSGFDPDGVEGGNGIANMKKRAGELNASVKIDSREDRGTVITVHKPNGSSK